MGASRNALLHSFISFRRPPPVSIETERLVLRLPELSDHAPWASLRRGGEAFLRDWEPIYAPDYLSRRAFRNRVYWAHRSREEGRALSLFLVRRDDRALMGAITLDNIRRGPAQMANVGYWIGPDYARRGYMREALEALVEYAFRQLDLSRIEAACLPENVASRGLLERAGFREEGVAHAYLQIAGRWRDHVLYARLRMDRRDGALA
jgi:[ribosomal protein S5]-alanine N-acetyltransferase